MVGRGKSSWNKLLGKPAIEAREKAEAAATLRKLEEKDEERRWAEERAQMAAKGKGKGKAIEEHPIAVGEGDSDEDDPHAHGMFHGAGKFLLAGGLAGAG